MAKSNFNAIIVINKNYMKNIHNFQFFSFFGIFITIFGWLALLLAFFNFFHSIILIGFLSLSFIFFIYLLLINKKNIKFHKDSLLAIFISIVSIIIFSHFTTPSIFSGRDQGSLSNAAIMLSKNNKPTYSFPAEKEFFNIYGEGVALNFPGFNYTSEGDLITHFPLGYVSWLSAFYSFFGIYGFIVANAISFFLFLFSFFIISKTYLRPSFAIITLLLIISSFVFSWFFKYTLSENLALGLSWFGLSQLIYFLKEKKQLYLNSFLLTFGLLLFVRIEAIAFLLIAVSILILSHKSHEKIKTVLLRKRTIFIFAIIILIFISSFKINNAFYINVAKGFLNSFTDGKEISSSTKPFEKFSYLIRALGAYTILNYIIIGFFSFIYFLKNKKGLFFILPYLIFLPTFLYIINPSITLDHPWFLRRYFFAVVPVSILFTAIFLKDFCKKKICFYTLSFFLLLTNLLISLPYFNVQENKNLLPQIEKISSDFEANDLILVDRGATSDPWSMMTGPMNLLYNKQAVYFFNPDDLKKINPNKFNNIYLITPDFNVDFYKKSWLGDKISLFKNYTLENVSLNIITGKKEDLYKQPIHLPQYQKNYTYGKIYLIDKTLLKN